MEEQLSSNRIFEQFINRAHIEFTPDDVDFWVRVFESYFKVNSMLTYNDLTEAIYGGTSENLEVIQENWSKIMEYYTQWDLDPELTQKFKKVEDHIQLAITQRSFILSNVETLKEELNKKSQELNSLTEELKTAKDTVESLKDIKTRIYTEFVAILGIFTAVVLGAFGSLQVIGSVFSNIKDVPTGKLLVFSSITSIGVCVLLFLLMRWINRIVYRDSDSIWRYNLKENLFFLMSLMVLVYMLVVGFLMYNEEPKNSILEIYSKGNFGIITFIVLTLITIAVLTIGVVIMFKENKNHKK